MAATQPAATIWSGFLPALRAGAGDEDEGDELCCWQPLVDPAFLQACWQQLLAAAEPPMPVLRAYCEEGDSAKATHAAREWRHDGPDLLGCWLAVCCVPPALDLRAELQRLPPAAGEAEARDAASVAMAVLRAAFPGMAVRAAELIVTAVH